MKLEKSLIGQCSGKTLRYAPTYLPTYLFPYPSNYPPIQTSTPPRIQPLAHRVMTNILSSFGGRYCLSLQGESYQQVYHEVGDSLLLQMLVPIYWTFLP
jgi:hypothetical protein